ncbi:MAG: ATP-binding protein, partial [Planctomycetota bacterium]|nr:ATP-binding protein [Planctomycetota bacterium]
MTEVYGLDDVQEIVDRVCKRVVQICHFETVLISLYFGEDIYIGLEGGPEAMRRRFLETARRTPVASRQQKRELIWRNHRVPDTDICWIPEGSIVPFSGSFTPSEEVVGSEWRPSDRLMVFVRGVDKRIHGILSLDNPSDGKRPDPNDLGVLETIDRFTKLIGVLIHNRHLAAKLRESEERYAAVVEQGHDGILIERDGQILFANRRVAGMLDVEPRALIGRDVDALIEHERFAALPGEQEGRLLRGDGAAVDVTVRTGAIQFGGASANLIAVADISERQRMLAQLMRAQKMESVGTLASGIAHDFNNLLGGILGYASLAKTCVAGNERAVRYVESIEKAADRASDVTRQLLGIVRDREVRVEAFDAARVLTEVASLLEETFDPSIEVVVKAQANLPFVICDESQLHQVLLNLSLNARDAMPEGGTLSLEAETAGDALRFKIRDTGHGMDAATLEKVFDPFFTTKSAQRGSGLGLYMAYRVIERHGGSIDITSEPGEGTCVHIALRASARRVTGAVDPATAAAAKGGGRVLLVDDEEIMRDVCGEMLRDLGYDVVLAANGQEAVDAVKEHGTSLRCVLLDISMPVMNGWEAARIIRDLQPDLPIVLSSGHDVDAATGHTQGIQVANCLKKPYRITDLRE